MRIKHIMLASAVLVSVSSFAQKDELKKLKKIYDKETPSANDLVEYKANLDKLAPLATEEGDKVYYNFYKANTSGIEMALLGPNPSPAQLSKFLLPNTISEYAEASSATLAYEKKTGKKILTDDIENDVAVLKPILFSTAISFGEAKKYKEAADVLYALYQLDKKDQDKLFYAASYAVNALDYDKALDYYNQLKVLNYSGEGTVYWATNKASKKEETFNTKNERDVFVKTGTHEKPRDEKLESKRGEIYKNIALILVDKGKINEAKAAVAEAKKENPNDSSLVLTEADLYLKVNDFDTYTKLVNEALAKEPNNVDLVYNLGVISGNANKLDEAEKYYRRALEINPNYFDANLNLAELKLRADTKLVTEMNKLGTSEKDNKRFEVLKGERDKNFRSVLPYLEKAVELKGDNDAAKKTLLGVYKALEMTDKVKELKAKM
ncbi:tetratricopeptide repeat protein [Flavobacterium sp. N1994]|uniref:tetratricopeptide repeat protein n=1 Tax=Flavobacterium sp. N1994 TaxID=2986827 RepID=UPI002223E289|nr:tetratricopeptide repeat protein [Flavobacterium sp. N1994]